jgi:hypothetical protein
MNLISVTPVSCTAVCLLWWGLTTFVIGAGMNGGQSTGTQSVVQIWSKASELSSS